MVNPGVPVPGFPVVVRENDSRGDGLIPGFSLPPVGSLVPQGTRCRSAFAVLCRRKGTMKKLMTTMLLLGALGVLSNPAPADATEVVVDCLNEAISSCDADFGGDAEKAIGIRGWCYAIRWGWCEIGRAHV